MPGYVLQQIQIDVLLSYLARSTGCVKVCFVADETRGFVCCSRMRTCSVC